MRNRTRDLPACSIVPQQTTLLRAPYSKLYLCLFKHLAMKISEVGRYE
jgi:hypothetical protein